MVARISRERHFLLLLVPPWPCRYAEDEGRQDGGRTLGCFGGRCHGCLLEQDTTMRFPLPNKLAAPNPAVASQLHVGSRWRGVGEPERSAL